MKPIDARKTENQDVLHKLYTKMYDDYNPNNKNDLKIGDKVRISAYKGIFTKGYKKNWTLEVFVIDQVLNTKPITYMLKDLQW